LAITGVAVDDKGVPALNNHLALGRGLLPSTTLSFLSSRSEARDLQFREPIVEGRNYASGFMRLTHKSETFWAARRATDRKAIMPNREFGLFDQNVSPPRITTVLLLNPAALQ
jgi:hypothetical protein